MTCEITGRPCCMGNEARCEIVSKGVCDFYNGTWHENFTLCSQVSGEKRSLCTPPSPPLRGGGLYAGNWKRWYFKIVFKGTGSRLSACSLIKLLLSNLLLILSVNNPTHLYLSDLRVYFKVELYFRVTWSRMEDVGEKWMRDKRTPKDVCGEANGKLHYIKMLVI